MELLRLDNFLLLGVLRVPAERIEAEVSRINIRLQKSLSFAVLWLVVSLDRVTLHESTEENEEFTELREL